MSKLEKLKEKARGLEAKDAKAAIAAWLDVIKEQESESEPNPDLSIFNRIGDLAVKVKDSAGAAEWYDRAVDKYAELGFHNNAIAMCNKVLRNAPGRQTTYLKLAKLYAAKGFMAEAQQNFVTYAERMQKAGKLQQAFAALKEFTDISPESEHLRQLLEEHLRMYGEPRMSQGRMSAAAPARPSKPPAEDATKSGKHKTSSLVFLDVDAPPASKTKPAAPRRPTAPPPPAPRPPEPEHLKLIEDVMPDPDTSLEIESTSLMQDAEGPSAAGMLEGLETTHSEYAGLTEDVLSTPSLREEMTADDVAPMQELEPTVPAEAEELEPLLDADLEIEPPTPAPSSRQPAPKQRVTLPKVAPPPAPKVTPVVPKRPPASPFKAAPANPARTAGPPPRLTVPKVAPPGPKAAPRVGPPPKPEAPKVKPVVPRRPSGPAAPPPGAPPKRKTVVEVPPLELEPDFDVAATDGSHDVDDEPLADESLSAAGVIETEEDTSIAPGRKSGFIDLGLDGVVGGAEETGSLVFADIEEAPAKPTIEQLEGRVADDPDDPEAHQALGEALIEAGERERGVEELDLATTGFETRGNLPQAQDLVDEILRLDPNSVRHRQKQVEFAFKSGDKAKLIDAYVELADTLLRSDLPDKARAVYKRVSEHDPANERAKAALAMLAPVATPPPEPPAKPKAKVRETEGKTAARDAKMTVRDEAVEAGDFVDLSAMILEEDLPVRDTRMKVADEEPTGDEERDFQEMLARFKQGIDENIDEGDFQSHYDLGVAFKEMGLLDEAIGELQKALRAPDGKLRSSEALGVCFIDKGAYVVAESILRRALDLPASGDQERLGVLYWLGRALEEQGKRVEARDLYGRVFAVDIRFRDVRERAKALAKAK